MSTADTAPTREQIFASVQRSFAGRLDVKLTEGPKDAPLLKAAGQSFAMLYDGDLVVRLHPLRCEELAEAGKGRRFVLDGEELPEWFCVDGCDAAQWTAHTMEALAWAKE